MGHRARLAFFGLSVEGSNSKVTVENFGLINNFLIDSKFVHSNTALYARGAGSTITANGDVVNINQAGINKVNLLGNLDFGEKHYPNTSQMNIALNGADSY